MTMYYPTLDQVRALAGQGNLCPVYRTINADLETPVSAYLKVARPPYSFLLESVAGGERIGRYSFIGTEPYDVFSTGADQPSGTVDPLTLVQREMDTFRLIPVEGPAAVPRRRRGLRRLRRRALLRAPRAHAGGRPPGPARVGVHVH